MKKHALVLALAVAACRTIVGIDELQGGLPGPNNPRDGGGPPGPGPASNDAGGVCPKGDGCYDCCEARYPAFTETFEGPAGKMCVCDQQSGGICGGSIEAACGAECRLQGDFGPNVSVACIECSDGVLAGESACANDACERLSTEAAKRECRDGLACFRSCGPP